MPQSQAPYFQALLGYLQAETLSFTMPGHNQGRATPPDFADFFQRYGLAGDITQVLGMDDIQRPTGPCGEAQQLAAQAYGADASYFLVNGSSSGIQAMFLSALWPGDEVLIPRNAHRSVWGALMLADARPAYYRSNWDAQLSVFHGPTVDDIASALDAHPDCKAVFLTYPTFYGSACDIQSIVDLAHARDKIVLVDQAWGPHLSFHASLPTCAVSAGADLVVQSTHKLASAMSQAAMIHRRGRRIDVHRLEQMTRLLMTTSASTLITASIDVARRQLALEGQQLLSNALELADWARHELAEILDGAVIGNELLGRPGVHQLDLTRLLFSGIGFGWTGNEIERALRYQHAIQLELSDPKNALALVTIGHSRSELERLLAAVKQIVAAPKEIPDVSWMDDLERCGQFLSSPPMTPRAALNAPQQSVDFQASVGRICAEFHTPYPPGIPILSPGDRIQSIHLELLEKLRSHGVGIQGPHDSNLRTIQVVS